MAEIRLFAGNFAPKNWASCDGQMLAISQNQALFSLLGTTYGGNGVTTFALPDLRGRVMTGAGFNSTVALGEPGGFENINLLTQNMPAHIHQATVPDAGVKPPVKVSSAAATASALTAGATLAVLGTQSGRVFSQILAYNTSVPDTKMKSTQVSVGALQESPAGANQPHTNRQPYLGIMHIICMYGIFPSRN